MRFFEGGGSRKAESSDRNKHIMIDLGTGNNNKMCVFRAVTCLICC